MAAKKTTVPTTPEPSNVDVEAIRAQRDLLNKQLRQATRKTTAPKVVSLAEVEAKQAEKPTFYACDTLAPLLAARVRAGASPEEAWAGLANLYGPIVVKAVQVHEATEGISWDDAIANALGRARKPRQGAK
jgi:hypothetical protein